MRRKQFGENNSSNDYRMANENRRIGSGRIPMRDSWDDTQYSKSGANDIPSNKTQPKEDGSPGASTSSIPSALGKSSEQSKTDRPSETSSNELNLRPGGGLLGLRDRQRESEQQTSQSSIVTQSHPHISRTILSSNSILDKDRTDFRERSVLGGDDRYDRRPFNRDRDRERENDRDRHRGDRDRDYGR